MARRGVIRGGALEAACTPRSPHSCFQCGRRHRTTQGLSRRSFLPKRTCPRVTRQQVKSVLSLLLRALTETHSSSQSVSSAGISFVEDQSDYPFVNGIGSVAAISATTSESLAAFNVLISRSVWDCAFAKAELV